MAQFLFVLPLMLYAAICTWATKYLFYSGLKFEFWILMSYNICFHCWANSNTYCCYGQWIELIFSIPPSLFVLVHWWWKIISKQESQNHWSVAWTFKENDFLYLHKQFEGKSPCIYLLAYHLRRRQCPKRLFLPI